MDTAKRFRNADGSQIALFQFGMFKFRVSDLCLRRNFARIARSDSFRHGFTPSFVQYARLVVLYRLCYRTNVGKSVSQCSGCFVLRGTVFWTQFSLMLSPQRLTHAVSARTEHTSRFSG